MTTVAVKEPELDGLVDQGRKKSQMCSPLWTEAGLILALSRPTCLS